MADVIDAKEDRLLGKFDARLIGKAERDGLLTRMNGELLATPQADAFARRAAARREDAFAAQHGERAEEIVRTGAEPQSVRRNLDHSPLASFSRLRDATGSAYFSADALAAGERLAEDFERGHMQPRITASWEPRLAQKVKGQRPAGPDLNDSALAARKRVSQALMALGPELAGVALDVCCFGKGLEIIERERQWPARSAKLMLRTALLSLHRHYWPQARKAAVPLHWGAEDYRPAMPAPHG